MMRHDNRIIKWAEMYLIEAEGKTDEGKKVMSSLGI